MGNTAVNQTKQKSEMSATKKLVINAMFIALTFIATMCVNIRLPIAANGGLIHLGNVPLLFAAALFGKKSGAIAGAFGMALFDLLSGWTLWAPFTFVVVGLMGYTAGRIMEDGFSVFKYWLAVAAVLVIKIAGYYAAEGIIYGNWAAPATSIPGNVAQVMAAAVISLPLIFVLKKAVSRL